MASIEGRVEHNPAHVFGTLVPRRTRRMPWRDTGLVCPTSGERWRRKKTGDERKLETKKKTGNIQLDPTGALASFSESVSL
jgi:hypothetical protein